MTGYHVSDKNRLQKSLHTNNPVGKPILRIKTSNELTQAQFVAREIKKVISGSNGLINYKDIAVLMRMNATSLRFEQTFRSNKIPFTIVSLCDLDDMFKILISLQLQ